LRPDIACAGLLVEPHGHPGGVSNCQSTFASTPGPDTVRAAFQAENPILNVDALPQLEWTPSDERLVRELGHGLGERVVEYQ